MTPPDRQLLEEVLLILGKAEQPLTAKQVWRRLRERGVKVEPWQANGALDDLARRRMIERGGQPLLPRYFLRED